MVDTVDLTSAPFGSPRSSGMSRPRSFLRCGPSASAELALLRLLPRFPSIQPGARLERRTAQASPWVVLTFPVPLDSGHSLPLIFPLPPPRRDRFSPSSIRTRGASLVWTSQTRSRQRTPASRPTARRRSRMSRADGMTSVPEMPSHSRAPARASRARSIRPRRKQPASCRRATPSIRQRHQHLRLRVQGRPRPAFQILHRSVCQSAAITTVSRRPLGPGLSKGATAPVDLESPSPDRDGLIPPTQAAKRPGRPRPSSRARAERFSEYEAAVMG